MHRSLRAVDGIRPRAAVQVLTSTGLKDDDSFEAPLKVVPRDSVLDGAGPEFPIDLAPWSFTVIRLKTR